MMTKINRWLVLPAIALLTMVAGAATTSASQPDLVADIQTTVGTITIRLFPDVAPNNVKNFVDLSRRGFYKGTKFHRIVPGFMIQGGDPNTKLPDQSKWGTGGSGENIKAEFNSIHHRRGILSMARSTDPNSASSQFFICVADAGNLDGQYSVFGEVVTGMDVVDKIVSGPARGEMALAPVSIEGITVRIEGITGPLVGSQNDDTSFAEAVRTYRATTNKPQLPEEVRRFRVQAEGAIRDKHFAEAANLYGQGLALAPWWPEGHFNRALVLSEIGAFSDAIAEMKRYLALVPKAPDARAAQDMIYEWERKVSQ